MPSNEQQSTKRICIIGADQTLQFAAEELCKYLERMAGGKARIAVERRAEYVPTERGALWLGTFSAFASAAGFPVDVLPAVGEPELDDAVFIDVSAGEGIVAGSNPRSVLIAVYRLLSEAGCRWVRPGPSGEYIPKRDLASPSAKVISKAAYRHRGICIEGAVSYENVAEIIDWAPKVGFNAYFIQFREGYTFLERWYAHRGNPTKESEAFSVEQAKKCVHKAAQEIKKRGLLYHAVGHGWTCEPLGIPGLSWDSREYDLAPEVARYLAEVNGKRAIWQGIPLNTNLCYSNPEVRRLIVEEIAKYAQEHPEIDILHFWLADGSNNQCECESCQKAIPSDFYVMMLNDLDELLSQKGLRTKVVFLIYVDLLWPPQVERIRNPERFVLMFAPITRTYSEEFTVGETTAEYPPYQRNQLKFPANVAENVAFLRAWQRQFQGDSFDFDYHLMWDHYNDPGYYQIARTLNHDTQHLKEIGLNGFVSCQVQRAFFPTGLPMVTLGRTLWDDKLSFEEIAEDYFRSAFGADGGLAEDYLSSLSQLFDPPYLRGERPQVSPEAAERFGKVTSLVHDFRPVIGRNLSSEDACWAASWQYLAHHAELAVLLAQALEARASGDQGQAMAWWERAKAWAQAHEDAVQSVFDLFEFIQCWPKKLGEVAPGS